MKHLWQSYIRLILISLLTFSCGGGGGSGGSATQVASGGIGGTGISKGPITKFGSIFVNDVEFETDGATVTIDGQTGSDSDLRLGMIVVVNGTIDEDGMKGQALTIDFEADIEGPIDDIDLANNTLVVLAQTVFVDAATSYGNTTGLAALEVNDMVDVSGFIAAGGAIQATRIELKSDPFTPGVTIIELKGLIQGLNTGDDTFMIGTQQVKYTGAMFEEMTQADLVNGLFIEAEGTRDAALLLNATRIEKEDDFPEAEAGTQLELEGFVTSFTNPSLFSVNGQAVQSTSATTFEGGAADDIKLNVRLEAKGTVDAGGILIATEISFRTTQMKIYADVEEKDSAANTVTLLGQTVVFNALTEIEDESSEEQETLTFFQISEGDRLEIKGDLISGRFIAKEVQRTDANSTVVLQGLVDVINNPTLTIFGVPVSTSAATVFQRKDETVLSSSTFFATVSSESTLKVEGRFVAGEILAEVIEIED